MPTPTVETVDAGPHRVARRVRVNAPAADIYAIVADPHRHPELDGSGTVRDVPIDGPQRLTPGDRFTVGMKQYGVPYKITSTVTDFEPGRVVEWQHPMGHRWRWELESTSPTTTAVTETFDYSTLRVPKIMELIGYDKKNGKGIEGTLRALAPRFA